MNFNHLNHDFISTKEIEANNLGVWIRCINCNIGGRFYFKNKTVIMFKTNSVSIIQNITCEEQQIKNLLE